MTQPQAAGPPSAIVDAFGFRLYDPATQTTVGTPAPFGRERVVVALPIKEGPRVIRHHRVIADAWGFALRDPVTGTLVGMPGVTVSRMLTARWTGDTRRA